jgi:hypothetical protein
LNSLFDWTTKIAAERLNLQNSLLISLLEGGVNAGEIMHRLAGEMMHQ